MSHYYDSSLNLVWSNVELKPSILMGIIIFFSILHQILDPVLDPVLDMVPHSKELKSNFLGWIAASLSFYDGSEYKLQFAKLNNILTRPRDRQTFSPDVPWYVAVHWSHFWTKSLTWQKICQLYIYHSIDEDEQIHFDIDREELRVNLEIRILK